MIFIVAKFAVRPQYTDKWLERTRDFTAATRDEPGNLWFDWSRSTENPNEFVLVEAFRDAEAGVAHVQSAHFKQAILDVPEMLVKTPEVINVEIPGTEWSRLSEMSVPGQEAE